MQLDFFLHKSTWWVSLQLRLRSRCIFYEYKYIFAYYTRGMTSLVVGGGVLTTAINLPICSTGKLDRFLVEPGHLGKQAYTFRACLGGISDYCPERPQKSCGGFFLQNGGITESIFNVIVKPQTILQLGLSPVSEQEISAKRFCRGVNLYLQLLSGSFIFP